MDRVDHNYQFDSNDDISTNNQTENAQQQTNIMYHYNQFPYVNNQNVFSLNSSNFSQAAFSFDSTQANLIPQFYHNRTAMTIFPTLNVLIIPRYQLAPQQQVELQRLIQIIKQTIIMVIEPLYTQVSEIRKDIKQIKAQIKQMKTQIKTIRILISDLDKRVTKLENHIYQASQSNSVPMVTQRSIICANSERYIERMQSQNTNLSKQQLNFQKISYSQDLIQVNASQQFLMKFTYKWKPNLANIFKRFNLQIQRMFKLNREKTYMIITFFVNFLLDNQNEISYLCEQIIIKKMAALVFDQPEYLYHNISTIIQPQIKIVMNRVTQYYRKYVSQKYYAKHNFQNIIYYFINNYTTELTRTGFHEKIKKNLITITHIRRIIYAMLMISKQNWMASWQELIVSILAEILKQEKHELLYKQFQHKFGALNAENIKK